MAEFLRILLILTALGSVLTGLLLLIRPLVKSKTVYYYLWLLVLLRLCLPVGITLPLPAASQPQAQLQQLQDQGPDGMAHPIQPEQSQPQLPSAGEADGQGEAAAASPLHTGVDWGKLLTAPALWFALWLAGAALCLGRYIRGYRRFSQLITAHAQPAGPQALALLAQLDRKGRASLAVCPYVSSPLLLGLIHPLIVLPCGTADDRLGDILAHELTHARRHDLLYKWFAVLVTSLHWMNPLMVVVRRQLARACELSCDQAVVRTMNGAQRRHYGETLLAMAARPSRRTDLLAVTLCEEGELLRERLVLVMKQRRQGPAALALTLVLVLLLSACATVLDAQPSPMSAPESGPAATPDPDALLADPVEYHLANGLTAALPHDLTDSLLVLTPQEGEDFLSVYDRYSCEAAGGYGEMGLIFSLTRCSRIEYDQSLTEDNSGRTFFARGDGWYYAYLTPTDVRFYSESEDQPQALALWEELNRRLPEEMLPDFIARNGLEAFDKSQEFHDGCLWDSQHYYVSYHTPDWSESVTLLLSQPAAQGEGGIWCVEGCFNNQYGGSALVLPRDTGMTAADYYAALQREAEAGDHPELMTPKGAALEWLSRQYEGVTTDQLTQLEGEPAWELWFRKISPILYQPGTMASLTYVDGQETQVETYGLTTPLPTLWSRLWVKAAAPAVLNGPAVTYTGTSGNRLIFLAEGGLVGIEQDGQTAWYAYAYDYDGPSPYESMYGLCQDWLAQQNPPPAHTYSDQELAQAQAVVEAEFAKFQGCTLESMTYDAQRSYEAAAQYRPTDDPTELNNRIVFFLTFTTDENQTVREPNATYVDFMMILRREDANSPWTVWDAGY